MGSQVPQVPALSQGGGEGVKQAVEVRGGPGEGFKFLNEHSPVGGPRTSPAIHRDHP